MSKVFGNSVLTQLEVAMKQEITIKNDFHRTLMVYSVPPGQVQFEAAEFERTNLRRAQLQAQNFENAVLGSVDLSESNLDGACFKYASLKGSDLTSASCIGANFQGADLGNVQSQTRTKVQGADFSNANLESATLIGVEYNDWTIFPVGFDPREHGMVKCET